MIIMAAGTGIPTTYPVPNQTNAFWNSDTDLPPVSIYAPPRVAIIIPNVAMKGGIRQLAMTIPFIQPQMAPTRMAPRTATGIGTLECNNKPTTTPEIATIEPTERSIPPEMITNVIPIAMMMLIDA